jgi:hypothetical protein
MAVRPNNPLPRWKKVPWWGTYFHLKRIFDEIERRRLERQQQQRKIRRI